MSLLPERIKKIPSKNKDARVTTLYMYIGFSDVQGQLWQDLAEIRTHPSFYAYPCYLQDDSIKMQSLE